MCLCVLILPSSSHEDLIIVGNRDEFIERPTAALSRLENGIYCGIDLVRGGTWLGLKPSNSSVRFAFLTNFRKREAEMPDAPSRGLLPMAWLTSDLTPQEFLTSQDFSAYSGMNLIIGISYPGNKSEIYATSNRGFVSDDARFERCTWGAIGASYTVRLRSEDNDLSPFAVALGNGSLGEEWVKVTRCEEGARNLNNYSDESLFRLMEDRTTCRDECLPDTGYGDDIERVLSPIFISPLPLRSQPYGTRTTTIMRITPQGEVKCNERNHMEGYDTCIRSTPIELDR